MNDIHFRCATCGVQTAVRCTSCNTMLCPDHLAQHLQVSPCPAPEIRTVNALAAFLARTGSGTENMDRLMTGVDALKQIEDEYEL